MDDLTAFRLVGIGVVADVKKLGSREIYVSPREERYAHQELVHNNPQKQSATVNNNGKEHVINATTNNSRPATWLAYNTTRKTPPDVRHGDEVQIYTVDDDTYYWIEMNTMDEKRLETVIFAISADPDNPMAEDYSNAYFFSWSSHQKRAHFRMNKVTDEYTGYSVEIDAKEGFAKIEDDLDNGVFIDSRNTITGMQNADGSHVVARKQDILGEAPRNISLKAGSKFTINCVDYECNATGSHKTNTPDAVFSTKITTPKAEINGIEHSTHSHIEQGDGKKVSEPKAG